MKCIVLDLRASSLDLRSSLVGVLLEVGSKLRSQGLSLLLERGNTLAPSLGWVQDLVWNTWAGLWNVQVEGWEVVVLDLRQGTVVDGVQDGSGVFKRTSLTTSGSRSTNPTGVQQPSVGVVLGDLVRQLLSVLHWVQDQEWLTETSRESGLWLSDTLLSTSHLRGVTRDKVVHNLSVGQLRNWRQDTAGITGQQDDVGWVSVSQTWDLGGWDEVNWVGTSGVLGDGRVLVVDDLGVLVVDNVLQDGTELDRVEDLWLLLGRQVQTLGVTATLDVENTVVGPTVLVVTDQLTVRVGRQGGLTSTGQTEEQGDVTLLSSLVTRRVQGQDLVLDWHQVEHNSEDTLLHLTGVLSTQDDHLHSLEVNLDGSGGGHTLGVDVGRELASVVDGEVWLTEVLELLGGWSDQHVGHEQSVVGSGTHNSDLDSVSWVPTSESINNEQLLSGSQVVESSGSGNLPGQLVDLLVNGSPPNVVGGGLLIDNSLVLWRSTGLLTRVGHQGTGGRDGGSLLQQTILVQGWRRSVVSDSDILIEGQLLNNRVLNGFNRWVTGEIKRRFNSSRWYHIG